MKALGLVGGTAVCGVATYLMYSQARHAAGAGATAGSQQLRSMGGGGGAGSQDSGGGSANPTAAAAGDSWLTSRRVQDCLVGFGGVAGAVGVALGAFGFHGLKST
eukprot:364327-Chlamydomonas_euryale.AAC.4